MHARPSRRLGRLVAAAAVLLLGLGAILWFRPSDADAPLPLGAGRVRLVAPVGAVKEYTRFEWVGELPPLHHFLLRISDESGQGAPTVRELEQNQWSVPAGLVLPGRIRWEISVVDPLSESISTAVEHAWRSP